MRLNAPRCGRCRFGQLRRERPLAAVAHRACRVRSGAGGAAGAHLLSWPRRCASLLVQAGARAAAARARGIALLPGSERGGLLAELMAAWDEGIAMVRARYEPMYERALAAALDRHGVDGVARGVKLTARAVQLWRDGWSWPGTGATLRRLLELSEDEEALRNQALIQDYFSRVRGAHRYIGRVLNDAVGETVLHERGRDSIPKLEALVGRDLTDLFDATSVLTVQRVSEPRDVPAGVCGSFLDPDDPYLKAKGATP